MQIINLNLGFVDWVFNTTKKIQHKKVLNVAQEVISSNIPSPVQEANSSHPMPIIVEVSPALPTIISQPIILDVDSSIEITSANVSDFVENTFYPADEISIKVPNLLADKSIEVLKPSSPLIPVSLSQRILAKLTLGNLAYVLFIACVVASVAYFLYKWKYSKTAEITLEEIKTPKSLEEIKVVEPVNNESTAYSGIWKVLQYPAAALFTVVATSYFKRKPSSQETNREGSSNAGQNDVPEFLKQMTLGTHHGSIARSDAKRKPSSLETNREGSSNAAPNGVPRGLPQMISSGTPDDLDDDQSSPAPTRPNHQTSFILDPKKSNTLSNQGSVKNSIDQQSEKSVDLFLMCEIFGRHFQSYGDSISNPSQNASITNSTNPSPFLDLNENSVKTRSILEDRRILLQKPVLGRFEENSQSRVSTRSSESRISVVSNSENQLTSLPKGSFLKEFEQSAISMLGRMTDSRRRNNQVAMNQVTRSALQNLYANMDSPTNTIRNK